MKPLYCKFKTPSNYYIYDTATNHIMKVSKFFHDYIDLFFNSANEQAFVEKCRQKGHSDNEINEFFNDLAEAQKNSIVVPRVPDVDTHVSREEYEEVLRDGLQYLILVITEDCNLRCRYCTYHEEKKGYRKHNRSSMTVDMAKKGIDYYLANCSRVAELTKEEGLKKASLKLLSFYGGEPLLEFKKVKILVEYFESMITKTKGRTFLTTNFTLVTPEIIDFFAEHEMGVTISLDGPREVHDRNRVTKDGKPTFDTVMRNLELLRKRAPDSYINQYIMFNVCQTHPIDYLKLERFFIHELELNAHQIRLISLFRTENYCKCTPPELRTMTGFDEITERMFSPSMKEMDPMNKVLHNLAITKLHKRYVYPEGWPEHGVTHGGPCIPGQTRLTLMPDGRFLPCERVPDRACFKIGDTDRGIDVEKAASLTEKLLSISSDRCRECWGFRLCPICMSFAYDDEERGLSDRVLRKNCESALLGLKNELLIYAKIRDTNEDLFNGLLNEAS